MHINNIRYYIIFTHQHPDCIGANVTVYRHFIEDLSLLPTCLFSVNNCVPHIIVILEPLVHCSSVTPPGNVYINEQLVNRLSPTVWQFQHWLYSVRMCRETSHWQGQWLHPVDRLYISTRNNGGTSQHMENTIIYWYRHVRRADGSPFCVHYFCYHVIALF